MLPSGPVNSFIYLVHMRIDNAFCMRGVKVFSDYENILFISRHKICVQIKFLHYYFILFLTLSCAFQVQSSISVALLPTVLTMLML